MDARTNALTRTHVPRGNLITPANIVVHVWSQAAAFEGFVIDTRPDGSRATISCTGGHSLVVEYVASDGRWEIVETTFGAKTGDHGPTYDALFAADIVRAWATRHGAIVVANDWRRTVVHP